MPRASSSVAGASTLMPGMCAYQPSRLCECCAASCRPAPVAMRITSGTLNWPPDMWRSVAALFTIWSSASRLKLTVMISTIGRMPPMRRADAGADERRLRQRRVADALRAELLEQPLAAPRSSRRSAPTSSPIRKTRGSRCSASRRRRAHRLAVGQSASAARDHASPPACRRPSVSSSTGSHVPASANATAVVDLGARPRARARASVVVGEQPVARSRAA